MSPQFSPQGREGLIRAYMATHQGDRATAENAVDAALQAVTGQPGRGTAASPPSGDPEGLGRSFDRMRDPLGSEADMATAVAHDALEGFCWAGRSLGWRSYDKRLGIWAAVPDEAIVERVRRWMLGMRAVLLSTAAQKSERGSNSEYEDGLAKEWRKQATARRIEAVTRLARGICRIDPSRFDAHPDVLNCPNGVVDLRTGERRDHDPALLLTQVTGAAYVPGAEHEDVNKALEAIPADVRAYAQLRYGQGVTGHKPPDDAIDVQHGSGENGKTTVLAAMRRALGSYAAVLPAHVLLAKPDAHTTDLMTLRGVRIGIIEELPEEHQLSVTRLKVATAPEITARLVHKDNVTFANACTLIISTNYRPQIRETDHGTWRRLEGSIPFPYTFRKPHERLRDSNDRRGDGTLRQRVETDPDGKRAEAMLAWLVTGAMAWYAGAEGRPPMTMGEPPRRVRADIVAWRESCDLMFAYMTDRLAFEPAAHVIAGELLTDLNVWLRRRGHRDWSMETLASRFEVHSECREHGVAKDRMLAGQKPGLSRPPRVMGALPQRYTAWWGVRFRDSRDEETAGQPGLSGARESSPTRGFHREVCSAPDNPDTRSFSAVMEYNFAELSSIADFEAAERLMAAGADSEALMETGEPWC